MEMRRSDFSSALDVGLRRAIHNFTKRRDPVYKKIFNILSSKKRTETDRRYTGFEGTVPQKQEGKKFTFDEMVEGPYKVYTHLSYGLGAKVTHEMVEDDLYNVMSKIPYNLGISIDNTIETLAAGVFNGGFADTGPDGLSLFNSAHVLYKSGGTDSNTGGAVDFGYSALKDGILAMEETLDDSGIPLNYGGPKILLFNPALKWDVSKILGGTDEPDTANNNINTVHKYGITPIQWSHLTDTNAWFLLASKEDHMLNWFWREKPRTLEDYVKLRLAYCYYVYWRSSVGYTDWRGTYGCPGSS